MVRVWKFEQLPEDNCQKLTIESQNAETEISAIFGNRGNSGNQERI